MEDLVMALVKTEGWVNIYKRLDGSIKIGGYNATRAEATTERTLSLLDYGYIATVKIEWED